MAVYLTNSTELGLIADAIRAKSKISEGLSYPTGFVDAINEIQPASSGGVVFYDYDGTIIDACSADDFVSLSAMPENPTHTGLIAQGWNWSLADAKTYVAKYGRLNIGQMYVTQSGATEIDVEMHEGRLEPNLTICVNGTITVDWGDNTTPDTVTGTSLATRLNVPHTYASEGSYTINILATGNNKYRFNGSSSITILRKYSFASNYENVVYSNTVQHIRIGNNAEIGENAFNYCYSLTSITIPDGVTSIGGSAFQYCYSLSSITIPDGVTSIWSNAFSTCYSLSSVTIPNSATDIYSSAFSNCYSLTSITIPDDVTSIGNSVVGSCLSLTSFTIPDSVTSISSNAFYSCFSLSSITIPDNITSIGSGAFTACYSLTSITIPDSVTSIGSSAFLNCYSLSAIDISDIIITSINATAFSGCYSLYSFTIPDSVTSIGKSAFYNCYSLSSITIPDSVTSIGETAFQSCYSLSIITIPDDVTSIGSNAFKNCLGVKEYHILPTTVPTGGTTMFDSISSDCIIYVPKGHLTDYQTATNWSTYASYMQEEPT